MKRCPRKDRGKWTAILFGYLLGFLLPSGQSVGRAAPENSDIDMQVVSIYCDSLTDSLRCTDPQDFGVVLCPDTIEISTRVGARDTFCIYIINAGEFELRVDEIETTPLVTVGFVEEETLRASDTLKVMLAYQPVEPEIRTGNLVVKVTKLDSDAKGMAYLPYHAVGLGPQIAVATGTIYFGDVHITREARREIFVSNVGTDTLHANFTTTEPFFVIGNSHAEIDSGKTLRLVVSFRPTKIGEGQNGNLLILSDSHIKDNLIIPLAGNGYDGPGIALEPDTVSFDTCLGTSQTKIARIHNPGDSPLRVWSVEGVNSVDLQPQIEFPLTVDGGDTAAVPIAFSPRSLIDTTLQIVARSNRNGGDSTLTVEVKTDTASFRLVPPDKLLEPIVAVAGSTDSAAFYIDNARRCPLFIDAIYVEPETLPFEVSARGNTTIEPFGRLAVWVYYSPKDTHVVNADIVVKSLFPASTRRLFVTGQGIEGAFMSVEPNPVNFGQLCVTRNSTTTLRVRNSGNALMVIDSVVANSGVSFSIHPLPSSQNPIRIGVGGEHLFAVTFSPNSPGSHEDEFTFAANSASGKKTLAVSGQAVEIELEADPLEIPFGKVPINSGAEVSLVMRNLTELAIAIDAIEIIPPDAPFAVEPSSGTLPSRDSTLEVKVEFTPTYPDTFKALLAIHHNVRCANDTIPLSGIGCAPQLRPAIPEIVFDTIAYCDSASLHLAMFNFGCDTLRIQNAKLRYGDVFEIDSITAVVYPDDSLHINLTFDPHDTVTGDTAYTDTLIVQSNLYPWPEWKIPIAGIAKDRTPPKINDTTECDIVGLPFNDEIVITAITTDNCDPSPACTLYVRRAGDESSPDVAIPFTGDRATVPESVIDIRGVEYRIKATDIGRNEAWDPVQGYYFIPFRTESADGLVWLETQTAQDAYFPLDSLVTSYRLISVPLLLDDGSVPAVIGDDLPNHDGGYNWRLFDYYNGNYHEYRDPTGKSSPRESVPGRAFWLITTEFQSQLDCGPGTSVPTSKLSADACGVPDYSRHKLEPGWNLVGIPYLFPIATEQCRLATGDTLRDIWKFDTDGGDAAAQWLLKPETLEPWKGYAVFAYDSVDLVFANIEFEASNTISQPKASISSSNEHDWHVKIKVQSESLADFDNFAGVRPGASEGWDKWDLVEPPVIGDYVTVCFPHQDWPYNGYDYAGDFRPSISDGTTWQFEVRSNLIEAPVQLMIAGWENVPGELFALLIDETHDRMLELSQSAEYAFKTLRENLPVRFQLVIGTKEYINKSRAEQIAQIRQWGLHSNFPNPFNNGTMISFSLATDTNVELVIYNVLGEKVRVLASAEWLEQGMHYIQWDGTSSTGASVVSGAYFVRFQAGGVRQIGKLLFLK